jgi:hypothetical protein
VSTQPADDSADLALAVSVLSAQMVAVFAQAETDLVRSVAEDARRGLAAPVGSAARLSMLREMRDTALRISGRLRLQGGPLARQVVDEAASRGNAQAIRTLTSLVTSHPSLLRTLTRPQPEPVTPLALSAANRIIFDLQSRLNDATYRITRFADDAYRAATARAATTEVLTGMSPAAAQRGAWDELTAKGVSGFTDSRGRRWNLASYVEMATRTAVQRAYNEAHQDRMTAAGVAEFTVAPHAHPCPLCQPWEGKVLTAATIPTARAAGLFHPNCTHVLVAYFEGITRLEPSEWTERDQRHYDAAQHLRALERRVRAAKLQEVGALDDLDAQRARRKVRAAQSAIRDHLATHPSLLRRRRREQLNLGNG